MKWSKLFFGVHLQEYLFNARFKSPLLHMSYDDNNFVIMPGVSRSLLSLHSLLGPIFFFMHTPR